MPGAIDIRDRSFRYGDGVFETIRVEKGILYNWEAHEARLLSGLRALYISEALPPELYANAKKTVAGSSVTEGFLRIVISRGLGSEGYLPREPAEPMMIIEIQTAPLQPEGPVTLWLSSYEKVSSKALPVECKTNNGLNSVLARIESRRNNCFEALLLNAQGEICEGSSANIFWTKYGVLYTPSLECGVLAGTTRAKIIELSPYPVKEERATLDALLDAEEVFLTNVAWQVLPVNALMPKDKRWNRSQVAGQMLALLREDITRYIAAKESGPV